MYIRTVQSVLSRQLSAMVARRKVIIIILTFYTNFNELLFIAIASKLKVTCRSSKPVDALSRTKFNSGTGKPLQFRRLFI
jgi:hypothetical protein